MAARIDYAISLTPIQEGTLDITYDQSQQTDVSNQDADFIDLVIARTLGGGKSDTVWTGTATAGWSTGTHTHVTSGGGTFAVAAPDEGVWIKHTGFAFDAAFTGNKSTVAETTSVATIFRTITTAEWIAGGGTNAGDTTINIQICKLAAGQAIFLPYTGAATYVITDSADPAAIEYATFT